MKLSKISFMGSVLIALSIIINGSLVVHETPLNLVSLSGIISINDASAEGDETKWITRKSRFDCEKSYTLMGVVLKRVSCTNCAWDCVGEEVDKDNPTESNCNSDYSCDEALGAIDVG